MFCKYCGTLIDDDAEFCASCGKKQNSANFGNVTNRGYTNNSEISSNKHCNKARPKKSFTFFESIKNYYINFANFSGRAVKSEYLWVCLYQIFISIIIQCLPEDFSLLGYAWSIIHSIPGLALMVRRLHDVGKSAKFCFVILIPLVGSFIFLYYICKNSDSDNAWGLSPYPPAISTYENFSSNPKKGTIPEKEDGVIICPYCGKSQPDYMSQCYSCKGKFIN